MSVFYGKKVSLCIDKFLILFQRAVSTNDANELIFVILFFYLSNKISWNTMATDSRIILHTCSKQKRIPNHPTKFQRKEEKEQIVGV